MNAWRWTPEYVSGLRDLVDAPGDYDSEVLAEGLAVALDRIEELEAESERLKAVKDEFRARLDRIAAELEIEQ